MTQDCASCFAAFVAPASAGSRFAGSRYCTRNAPLAQSTNPDAWLWPLVADDWTCREGADAITGQSYAVLVNGQPGTGGAGPGYLATSITNLTIASTGSLAPVTQLNLAYTAGARVRLTSTGSAAWMEGVVTNYAADGTLTFTADSSSGSGSHTDWDINLAGQPGASGVASKSTFTFAASSSTTVLDPAVTATSYIGFIPTNADAANLLASTVKGGLYVSARNAGVSFVLTTGLGASGAGTETFSYVIIN